MSIRHQYLNNVATLQIDDVKCIGCGLCLQVCPHEVFMIRQDKAFIVDKNRCMECGACAMNCPTDAVTVRAGVGCAYAILVGKLTGTEPNCSGVEDEDGCC
jgi:ferredoxin